MRFNVKRILTILLCFSVLLVCYGCKMQPSDEYDVYGSAITKVINNFQFYSTAFEHKNIKANLETIINEDYENKENRIVLVITGSNQTKFVFFEDGSCDINVKRNKLSNNVYELDLSFWHKREGRIRIFASIDLYVDNLPRFLSYCLYENGNFEHPIDDTKDISYGFLPVEEPTYEDREKADKLIKEAFTTEELEAYYAEAMSYFDLILEVSKIPV